MTQAHGIIVNYIYQLEKRLGGGGGAAPSCPISCYGTEFYEEK